MDRKKLYKLILAFALLLTVIIVVLLFKPFVTCYLPSRVQTILDEKYYYDWYTQNLSLIGLFDPLILVILPALIAAIGIIMRICKNVIKKSSFIILKLTAIANLFCMYNLYDQADARIYDAYKKAGAYVKITSIGIFDILLSVCLLIVAVCLSRTSKKLSIESV